eukprot:795180-Pelagomonas_calceolata.AAC.7
MDNGVSPTQAAAPAPDTCPDTPTAPECATYKYPAERVQQDLDALCSAMPDMPGCSVRNACQRAQRMPGEQGGAAVGCAWLSLPRPLGHCAVRVICVVSCSTEGKCVLCVREYLLAPDLAAGMLC